MLPNRATTVETSRTSHVVTSPIPSHYHHHHPPPPPLRAAATAAVGPPGERPLLGQSGVSSSTPPAPNDVAHEPTTSHPITPPNNAQQRPRTRHVSTQRQRPTNPTNTPRHRPTTPANDAHQAATSPPNDAQHRRHVTTGQRRRHCPCRAPPPPHHYRKETAGGGDGGEGRTKGENTGRGGLGRRRRLGHRRSPDFLSTPGGMEGRGQRRTPSLPPRVDEGVGWHIRASYFLPPPVPAASSTGAGVNPTRRPPFDFVYPPHWGVFFSCVVNDDGGSVCITCCPIFIFYP